jgi:predicted DCC family thiol-disulfide oxidoreductase YuxK
MRQLTILYDADCSLCQRARGWLSRQSQFVPLYFVAAGGPHARRRFPDLDHDATLHELTVVADGGQVYRGAKAWVMCLWALHEYRSFAMRLGSPSAMGLAERFVKAVAKNRHRLSLPETTS